MKVGTEDIRAIRPGEIKPFLCDDANALNCACSLTTRLKRVGMPKGVVNYETQKFYDMNLLLVRAMREGDVTVLNQ